MDLGPKGTSELSFNVHCRFLKVFFLRLCCRQNISSRKLFNDYYVNDDGERTHCLFAILTIITTGHPIPLRYLLMSSTLLAFFPPRQPRFPFFLALFLLLRFVIIKLRL
jgi:hypothetical protein